MKAFTLLCAVALLFSCDANPSSKDASTSEINIKSPQAPLNTKSHTNPLLAVLKGQWQTSYFVRDGIQTDVPQQYTIEFLSDSLYQVIGLNKGGEWFLNNDTLIVVSEITDKYMVVDANDSVLHTKGLVGDTADFYFKKVTAK